VEEFWVCQNCKSLNRAGSSKCYSCRAKYGSSAPEPQAVSRNAPATAPPPQGPIPDFGAAAAQAPQYARLAALAPAATAAGAVATAPSQSPGFSNPIAAVKRRIATSLSMRPSVSVTALGYATSALLVLLLALGALWLLAVMPVAADLLQHADAAAAGAQLSSSQQGSVESLSIAMLVAGAVTWLCFSVFVGLTTHNAIGLGADQPLLSPYNAAVCWGRLLFTQARVAVGLIVPVALVWQNYVIPGLLAGIIAVEIAHHHLDDQSSWLSRPARHLPDLYIKLGVQGSISSRLASLWSACFRMANALAILVAALPALALTAFAITALTGHRDLVTWQSSGFGAWQVATALLVGNLVGWTAASVALLIALTIGLVRRQKVRRTLVRVGRARSWVARPGEGGYTPGPKPQPTGYDDIDDEDRIVERLPRFPTNPAADPGDGGSGFGSTPWEDPALAGPGFGSPNPGNSGFGGPGFGGGPGGQSPTGPSRDDSGFGSGFGGAGPGGAGFGDPRGGGPDQASLNSPSTTSSFPWSVGPPSEPD
jgi:hypothetical protein